MSLNKPLTPGTTGGGVDADGYPTTLDSYFLTRQQEVEEAQANATPQKSYLPGSTIAVR